MRDKSEEGKSSVAANMVDIGSEMKHHQEAKRNECRRSDKRPLQLLIMIHAVTIALTAQLTQVTRSPRQIESSVGDRPIGPTQQDIMRCERSGWQPDFGDVVLPTTRLRPRTRFVQPGGWKEFRVELCKAKNSVGFVSRSARDGDHPFIIFPSMIRNATRQPS